MNGKEPQLHGNNEMLRVGCHDCKGCFECCTGMGDSVWLDPYDVHGITTTLKRSFAQLMEREVELHMESGLVIPNIRMIEKCVFLDENGRCSIHACRPGLCRLFPLGRDYSTGKVLYFLLEGACPAPNKTKIKVQKWLDIPRLRDYETYLTQWHQLTKGLRAFMEDADEPVLKAINMQFLQIFYMTPYGEEDFYGQFANRMEKMKSYLETLGICLGE